MNAIAVPEVPAHVSVLLDEVVAALDPKAGETFVDGTLGGGGYARALMNAADCIVYGVDRDPKAIAAANVWGAPFDDRLALIERPFSSIEETLAGVPINGFTLDLGVSAMQLDEPDRGFSFRHDGPLSMRMDGGAPDATTLVNAASQSDLFAIIRTLGEEKAARRIAAAIVAAREAEPIERTDQLARIVESVAPRKPGDKIHPATRTFQGLRIFVNDELGELARALGVAERLLQPGGRLAVVTFHSLEDRIVKRFLTERSGAAAAPSRHAPPVEAAAPTFTRARARAIAPHADELASNPRARSAKLRVATRTAAPARFFDPASLTPTLPDSPFIKSWRF